MSISAMAFVWESDLPATERLVLLSIADHADERDECYPSISRLMARTGLSERAVQGAIKRLCDGGYLLVKRGGGRSNTNLFRVTKPRTKCTPHQMHPAGDAPETPHMVRENPAGDAPEPSRTTNEPSNMRIRGFSFADFWSVWPNKVGKVPAEKAWRKLSSSERAEAVASAASWFAAWSKSRPDASPIYPASYLDQRRWQDEGWRPAPVRAVDRMAVAAEAIRSGKRFLCSHITPSQARELVAANAVTPEQCKQVGVSL